MPSNMHTYYVVGIDTGLTATAVNLDSKHSSAQVLDPHMRTYTSHFTQTHAPVLWAGTVKPVKHVCIQLQLCIETQWIRYNECYCWRAGECAHKIRSTYNITVRTVPVTDCSAISDLNIYLPKNYVPKTKDYICIEIYYICHLTSGRAGQEVNVDC